MYLEDEDENLPPPVFINPEREDDHPPLLIPEHPDEAVIGTDLGTALSWAIIRKAWETSETSPQNLTYAESGSSSSCSRQDKNPRIPEQYNASKTTRPDASSPPHNDPTQNDPVPGNHLQISRAPSSNSAGPSGGHSSSSPETQSNSRKRKRESDFPSCSFDSPEMEESPSKRRRSNSRLGWNNSPLSIGDEQYDASTMSRPDASTPPRMTRPGKTLSLETTWKLLIMLKLIAPVLLVPLRATAPATR
ncbi:hypothetical protein MHYP_G00127710 [Metynnis hypsauchen]